MEKLVLKKPIKIDGKEVTELPYDFENMTARDKINAGKNMMADGVPMSTAEELDSNLHIYLFAAAVHKADDKIDVSDVLRISAKDSQRAGDKARDFFYLGSEE